MDRRLWQKSQELKRWSSSVFQDSAVYLYPEQQLAQTRIAMMQWLSKGFRRYNKYVFDFMY